ncbi:glutaredoxin family protein [Oceanobacillus damuensis]|uniref:glutaredoxin family protein n=1 Tax=Oceanobacillus damuensis TaxID=937928 RepID=UPI0008302B99|nr:glutaredoxin family protein [Oceanobacillus damuensis]
MQQVILYTKATCTLCDEAEALLSSFKKDYPHQLIKRDIYSNEKWLERYQLEIPVIEIDGKQLNAEEINYNSLKLLLTAGYKGELEQ